ncbi:uncharacterized protein LOC116337273 [Contarinia nasturtii]|uniref:uncharacterized protein LOC116337273 n=1 Tax=Contarinia nasturtii TaxID=265458 RepID=UPI0012D44431|nr:uncharacterized protein LOC116337273 [Contarinia nasturtii]
MFIYFYTILLALLLSDCAAMLSRILGGGSCFNGGQTSGEVFDIDDFVYNGDPITFACISSKDQFQFDIVRSNNSLLPVLHNLLNNGRGLSLFFHGIGNTVSKDGLYFRQTKEWFSRSDKNICIITYAFLKDSVSIYNIVSHLNKMVKTRRLEFVAKQARDFVLNVRERCLNDPLSSASCLKHMSQVEISGYSFGGHIASRTCDYLFQKTNEKVKMLLALDPSGNSFLLNKVTYPKRGDANYVQVIHTSGVGITRQVGDVDIYLTYKSKALWGVFEKHDLGLYMHFGTSTKRFYLIGEENGNGTIVVNNGQPLRQLKPSECLIGIYGTLNEHQKGKRFEMSLVHREEVKLFWDTLGEYAELDQFD